MPPGKPLKFIMVCFKLLKSGFVFSSLPRDTTLAQDSTIPGQLPQLLNDLLICFLTLLPAVQHISHTAAILYAKKVKVSRDDSLGHGYHKHWSLNMNSASLTWNQSADDRTFGSDWPVGGFQSTIYQLCELQHMTVCLFSFLTLKMDQQVSQTSNQVSKRLVVTGVVRALRVLVIQSGWSHCLHLIVRGLSPKPQPPH